MGDGRAATLADFQEHRIDTYTFVGQPDHMEIHMFPDIVAEVYYDQGLGAWHTRGRGVTPRMLSLKDPNIDNHQIIAEFHLPHRLSGEDSPQLVVPPTGLFARAVDVVH